jgi:hypothetical protein
VPQSCPVIFSSKTGFFEMASASRYGSKSGPTPAIKPGGAF